jgi:hypothetical protein
MQKIEQHALPLSVLKAYKTKPQPHFMICRHFLPIAVRLVKGTKA